MKSQLKEKAVSLAYSRLENAEITITMREISDIVARAVDEALEAQAKEHRKEPISSGNSSTISTIEQMIAEANANWVIVESLEVDTNSFDNILLELSRSIAYGSAPNIDMDEFTLNVHGTSVQVRRGIKEKSYGV